jgi:hypothetical protein
MVDDDAARESLRRFSKSLLGSRLRLEVIRAVASAEPSVVYARQIAQELSIADNQAALELGHLFRSGLVRKLPRAGGPHVHYERLPSAVWQLADDLAREVHDGSVVPLDY